MTKRTFIPSDDVYTYHKQALDMLPTDHPHYEEVKTHLYNQIKDELADKYHARTDRSTDTTREDTDFARAEAS